MAATTGVRSNSRRTAPSRNGTVRTGTPSAASVRATGATPSATQVAAVDDQVTEFLRRARGQAVRGGLADLDATSAAVLAAVAGGVNRAADLAAQFGIDKAAVSRQVRALEERGLLTRTVDSEDARAWRLVPTRAGRRAVDAATAARRRATKDLLAGWSETQAVRFAEDLARFNSALRSS